MAGTRKTKDESAVALIAALESRVTALTAEVTNLKVAQAELRGSVKVHVIYLAGITATFLSILGILGAILANAL